jgi:hypothetical protein
MTTMDRQEAQPLGVPKVHPATRPMLPEDPLELHSTIVPGQPRLMLQLLAEEYARWGASADDILALARDGSYMALHGLWQQLGAEETRRVVEESLCRCGVTRVTAWEQPADPEVVSLELPPH